MLLRARAAIITGAAAGIGREIVETFAASGAVGAALDLPAALAAVAPPAGWINLPTDVRDEAAMAAAFDQADRHFGRVDTVVANAGIVPPWRDTEALDLDEWDAVFAVNVRGVAAAIKHAVPLLRRHGGSIVVMASINAFRAHPRQALYTATKHAALGLTRAAALDLGRYGIRVNAIGPGPIATEALLGRMRARAEQGGAPLEAALAQAADTALGRMATARDVANTALFLASDLSAGLTGALLPVDGGLA